MHDTSIKIQKYFQNLQHLSYSISRDFVILKIEKRTDH